MKRIIAGIVLAAALCILIHVVYWLLNFDWDNEVDKARVSLEVLGFGVVAFIGYILWINSADKGQMQVEKEITDADLRS